METFNLAQLTKEMVVGQLRSLADPAGLAGETVRGTLIARLKGHRLSNHEIQEAVEEVCRGGVQGLVLMDCSLARGGARLLRAAEAAAKETGLCEELVAVAAIKGISDTRRFATREVQREMAAALNEVRMGAGDCFERFCADLHPHQSHPGYVPPSL